MSSSRHRPNQVAHHSWHSLHPNHHHPHHNYSNQSSSPAVSASAAAMDELVVNSQFPDANAECLTLNLELEVTHRWQKLADCPGECSKHTMVNYMNTLYIFGGDDGGRSMLNHLLIYDITTNTWSQPICRGSPPAARYHHSAVVAGKSMLIFGGYTGDLPSNSNLTNKNDLFEYHFPTSEWREWRFDPRRRMPVPRAAHGAAVHDNKLWIFGGYDGNCRLNDMWYVELGNTWTTCSGRASTECGGAPGSCWHTGSCTGGWHHSDSSTAGNTSSSPALSSASSPHQRWTEVQQVGDIPPTCCNFAITVARDSVYLFSGHSGARITNKLFQFHFASTTWTRINTEHILCGSLPAPEKRYGHTMAAYNRHLYVFGGATGGTVLPNQLHCYDLDTQSWSVVEPVNGSEMPSGRLFHSSALVDSTLYILGGTMDNNRRSRELVRIALCDSPPCTLKDDFARLLERHLFTDLIFILDDDRSCLAGGRDAEAEDSVVGDRVEAHIAIVAARSPFLLQRIRETRKNQKVCSSREDEVTSSTAIESVNNGPMMTPASNLEVRLTGVEGRPFRLILDYIYTDKICPTGPGEDLFSIDVVILMIKVYELAIKFQLTRLESLFLPYFESLMSIGNVLVALRVSWQMGINHLVNSCLRFIVKEANYDPIVMSTEFESLDKALMVEIVRRRKRPNASYPFSLQDYQQPENEEIVRRPVLSPAVEPHEAGNSLEEDMEAFLLGPVGLELADISLELGPSGDDPAIAALVSSVTPTSSGYETSSHSQNTRASEDTPPGPVWVHKAVLAARSTYFEAMFRSMRAGQTLVRLQLIPAQLSSPPSRALHSLLRYIYLGDTRMSPGDSLYLFTAPYYFGFTNARLQLTCKQNLEVNISVDNVIEILEAADRVQASEMKEHALGIIITNPQTVMTTSPPLTTLKSLLLIEIIQALAATVAASQGNPNPMRPPPLTGGNSLRPGCAGGSRQGHPTSCGGGGEHNCPSNAGGAGLPGTLVCCQGNPASSFGTTASSPSLSVHSCGAGCSGSSNKHSSNTTGGGQKK